ncbi:MAG: hypothetical protein M3R38_17645 [Actinomycetota bacterium]|nr:hypothetical protein [Actinomycetota bacterium]
MSRKSRNPPDRISLGLRFMRRGLSLDEAARRASVSPEQLRRALGIRRPLPEGDYQDHIIHAQANHDRHNARKDT